MRVWALVLAILGAACAGCQSEEDERAELVKAATDGCVVEFDRTAAGRPGVVPQGFDSRRLCTCALERATQGMSIEQVRDIGGRQTPGPEMTRAMGACVVEEARRTGVMQR